MTETKSQQKNWRKVKLGDVTQIESGGTPASSKTEYWDNGDIYWVTLPDLKNKYIFDTQRKITQLGLKKSSAKLLPINSVIFSSRATIGEVAITKVEASTNQGSKNFICNPEEIEYEFLYYLLKSKVDEIRNLATGATYKEINKTVFSDIEIKIPDLLTQKQIADVLSTYDELIENNTRRIQILEELAQTIYKEWFVHFRFPGHEKVKMVDSKTEFGKIPEGWKVGVIGDIVDLLSGYSFKSKSFVDKGIYKIITIKSIQDGNFVSERSDTINDVPENIPDHCVLKDGDILLSLTGNVGRICIAYGRNMLLNQRVAKLSSETIYVPFVYSLFRNSNFKVRLTNIANGSAQQNLSPIQTSKLPIVVPEQNIVREHNELISPVLSEILVLNKQNARLRQARDLLLPKLVTGEIEV